MNSKEIEAEIKALEDEKAQSANEAQKSELEEKISARRKEYWIAVEAEKAQGIEEKVVEAETAGYLLDTLTAKDGSKMIELSHTQEDYNLMRIAVQRAFVEHEEYWKGELNRANHGYSLAVMDVEKLTGENDKLTEDKRLLTLDKVDLTSKLENAASLILEHEKELRQQAATISKLLENQATPAEIKPLTADEEEAKWIAEKMGKRIKVTKMRFQFPDTFNTVDKLANNALTGELIEYKDIYEKRYLEITEGEAIELRAEYAQKKADLEAQFKVEVPEAPDLTGLFEGTAEPEEKQQDFREETQTDGSPVDQGNVNGEVEAQAVGEATQERRVSEEAVEGGDYEETTPFTPTISRVIFDSLQSLNDRLIVLERNHMKLVQAEIKKDDEEDAA